MAPFAIKLPPQERLVPWVNAALVVALAYVLAQATWLWVPERPLPEPRQATVSSGEPRRESVRLQEVARLHLFGVPQTVQTVEAEPVDAPDTRLNLILRGVFAAVQPDAGTAIIADPGGNEAFYGTGDGMPGGATLKAVYADRVILTRSGQFETLRLPEASAAGISLDDQPPPATGASAQAVRLPELNAIRKEILENPTSVMDLVRMQPVTESGRLKGYRVSPGRNRDLFLRAGLRLGDIVTGINGIGVDDPGRLNEIFQQLSSSDRLDLTLERGGREHRISVNLN